MSEEDLIAAKLKGYNCLIKFKDGEELLLKVEELNDSEASIEHWFGIAERFINSFGPNFSEYFPAHDIALSKDAVKYVMKI